ncbi:MAG: hypothetical protein OXE76_13650 [Alphaproteobacteria bacterium]|nr:hypothetical protein [Alphaproteobacteria bacterium]
MPLSFHIRPERPFTTVFTEIGMPDWIDLPEYIRTYATRGACNLQRWRKRQHRVDYEDDEPYHDNACDLIKYDSTCSFEVYERLRLAHRPVSFYPWVESSGSPEDEPGLLAPDRQNDAGGDFDRLSRQDGFDAFLGLMRLTSGTAHDPQEGRFKALIRTIETLAARRSATTAASTASEVHQA